MPIQYLALSAGLAVRGGLSEDMALQSITIQAAKVIGMENRLGSLEPGKDADVVVFAGHPFDTRTKVKTVLINGERRQEE